MSLLQVTLLAILCKTSICSMSNTVSNQLEQMVVVPLTKGTSLVSKDNLCSSVSNDTMPIEGINKSIMDVLFKTGRKFQPLGIALAVTGGIYCIAPKYIANPDDLTHFLKSVERLSDLYISNGKILENDSDINISDEPNARKDDSTISNDRKTQIEGYSMLIGGLFLVFSLKVLVEWTILTSLLR